MKNAIYNPNSLPESELPTIYGFNNGGHKGFLHAQLMAEDGTPLGSHICSAECYMTGDLGIIEGTRPDRHEFFRKHYPDGYKMEFVGLAERNQHSKLMAAIKIANDTLHDPHPDDASVVVTMAGEKTRMELPGGWYLMCTDTASMAGPYCELYDPNDCPVLTGEMAQPELFVKAMNNE